MPASTIIAVDPKLCNPRMNHPRVRVSWMKTVDAQAVVTEGAYAVASSIPVRNCRASKNVSTAPKTYHQRAPPGIGSSVISLTTVEYPVRWSSQAATRVGSGGVALVTAAYRCGSFRGE